MKRILILLLLTGIFACSYHSNGNQKKHGNLEPAWVFRGSADSTSLVYLPGNIAVYWSMEKRDTTCRFPDYNSEAAKSGVRAEGNESERDGRFYNAFHLVKGNDTILVESAINEKEMVLKLRRYRPGGDIDTVHFVMSFPADQDAEFRPDGDIIEADLMAEKIFFHHYGSPLLRLLTSHNCAVVTLALHDSLYFYSGDERSPIYLDEVIARKKHNLRR